METGETFIYVLVAVMVGASVLLFLYVAYRGSWGKHAKYARHAPLIRSKSILEHPLLGPLEVDKLELLSGYRARIRGVDADGRAHFVTAYADEISPSNIWQCMIGPGNPQFRFRAGKVRLQQAMTQEDQREHAVLAAVEHKLHAEHAKSEARMAEASKQQAVDMTIENLAKLQKAQQQPVGGMRR